MEELWWMYVYTARLCKLSCPVLTVSCPYRVHMQHVCPAAGIVKSFEFECGVGMHG